MVLRSIKRWLFTKRVCSWCRTPVDSHANAYITRVSRFDLRGWMGGNPFAKNVTHGICKGCKEAVGRELMKRKFIP